MSWGREMLRCNCPSSWSNVKCSCPWRQPTCDAYGCEFAALWTDEDTGYAYCDQHATGDVEEHDDRRDFADEYALEAAREEVA